MPTVNNIAAIIMKIIVENPEKLLESAKALLPIIGVEIQKQVER